MKRAQIQSQVFIFIMLAVVISLTVIFGFRAIKSITSNAADMEKKQFISDVKTAVDGIGYGDANIIILKIPPGNDICFLNTSDGNTIFGNNIINNAFANDNTTSIYLVGKGIEGIRTEKEARANVTGAGAANAAFCIKYSDANKRIYLEGMGKYVLVAKYNGI